jgi:hypothetical protein
VKPPRVRELEREAYQIGRVLADNMPPDMGFALVLFDLGRGGFLTWMSNAQRQDMITLLRELTERLETGTADTAGREA